MSNTNSAAEHTLNKRRRRRQLLGAVLAVLIVIGIVTVFRAGRNLVSRLFDDTEERLEIQSRIEGFVMFDPLPFEGIENMDDLTLREAAVWGCIYSVQESSGSLENYARDPETDQMLLPAVEVDAWLARVVGPSFHLNHTGFEMEDMYIGFDETVQAYRIPVTGGIGSYTGEVIRLEKKNGRLRAEVACIPMDNSESSSFDSAAGPAKYMDYIFEKNGGNWYLTAVEESERKAENAPDSVPAESTDRAQELREALEGSSSSQSNS